MAKSSRLPVATVAALCFLSFVCSIRAQKLTAVKCTGALPSGRSFFPTLYDQLDDSIYIFGGSIGISRHSDEVLKYSIHKDTTEIVGHLPYADYAGGAVMSKFRNIFYLSGSGGYIYQYFPELQSFANVSGFAEANQYFATVRSDPDTALLFGGFKAPTSIISLNLNDLQSEQIAHLPENASFPAVIWVEENNLGYIFNGRKVFKYSRASNRTETLELQVPFHNEYYTAIWDGRFGYLIGRLIDDGSNPTQSLLQFNPETETFRFIHVEDYEPVDWPNAVYIQKLNRIYLFGGYSIARTEYHDAIWYIDLDPLDQPPPTTTEETPIPTMDPDIFNCGGRPDDNYPYPGDCTKFVICYEDHGYPFNCSDGLHFDPINRHCTFPDKAGCE